MKHKLITNRSSYLTALPVLALLLVAGLVTAFFGLSLISGALLLLFLIAVVGRLWAWFTARKLTVSLLCPSTGLFPGEELVMQVEVHNDKLLPVLWMELFSPLSPDLCLMPENPREPERWERLYLQDRAVSTELVGEKRLPSLLWHQTTDFPYRWTAKHRGVYSMSGWRLRTGDGFAMAQVEQPLPPESMRSIAVYPKLVPVDPSLFLRNLWNADTGTRGVMEDITVIRSTRDYQPSDPFKSINWRLAARGLPLSVNVYETILPRSVHFIFDGESFSGPPSHLEELEDALSILASELIRLSEQQVDCGLSLCRGAHGPALNLFAPVSLEEMLFALADYQPEENIVEEGKPKLPKKTVFDDAAICNAAQHVGRFYYITYSTARLADSQLLQQLDHTELSILTYKDASHFGDFEVFCLQNLKEGPRNE